MTNYFKIFGGYGTWQQIILKFCGGVGGILPYNELLWYFLGCIVLDDKLVR